MPISFPDGSTIETPEELEALIKANKMPREKAQAARLEHQREMLTKQIAAARARVPGTASGPSPVSFGLNMFNEMGAGAPVAGASALTAPVTAIKRGVGLGEAYDLNRSRLEQLLSASPASAAAGKVGAYLVPNSPIAGVAKAGFRAAGGVKLAELAAKGAAPGAKWAGQLLSAFAGSAGAIAATNAVKYPFGEDSAAETVQKTLEATKDPLNIAVTAGLGGLAAAARSAPDLPTRNLLAWAERKMPGFKPSPDMSRDPDGFMASLVDAMSKSAHGRRVVSEYVGRHFYEPLRRSVDEIAKAAGLSRGRGAGSVQMATEKAGSAVQRLVGVDDAGKAAAGSLAARRKAINAGAFAQAGNAAVPAQSLAKVARVLDALDARASAKGPLGDARSGAWQEQFNKFREATKQAAQTGRPVPAQALEDFRQTVGSFSKFRAGPDTPISARDVREARVVYWATREALRETSPVIDNAMRRAADLHAASRSLKQVVNAQAMTPAQTVLATVQAPNFTARWKTLKQQLTADELDAFRGSYLGHFLADVAVNRGNATKAREALNLRAMDKAWSRTGPFQQKIFDAVFDGASMRADLRARGMVSDVFLRSGLGRAEGSQTAGREAMLQSANDALDTTVDVMSGRAGAIGNAFWMVLGQAGRLGLAEALLNGKLRDTLVAAGTGQPLPLGQVVPAALQSAGGIRGVINSGQSTTADLGGYE